MIKKSFRMSNHDLQVRPVYHHERDSIKAHLTIAARPSAAGSNMPPAMSSGLPRRPSGGKAAS